MLTGNFEYGNNRRVVPERRKRPCMTLRTKALKGSVLLSGGQAVSQGCAFIRNIILVRLLTKEDFGLAATFAITISLFEMVNRLGVSGLIVQSRNGEDARFQATAHSFQLLAGLASAFLIFIFAGWVSVFFNATETLWAFQILAVIPIMQGLGHLDVNRMVRSMRYLPVVLVDTVPQVLITIAALPLALWLRDYRVILWLLIARWVMNAGGTHVYAERGFQFGWDKRHIQGILDFSWPLLINGFLMFGVLQGDCFLVGHFYTKADLAVYSVAVQLTLIPGMMFVSVVGAIMLPLLSAVQSNPVEFRRKYRTCIQALSAFSAVFAIVLIVAGEGIVTTVFGHKYAGTGVILGWLVAANAFRIIRAAPAIAASAKGDTKNLMISNIFRLSGLALGVAAVLCKQSLPTLAACGLAGETLATIVSSTRLSRVHRLPLGDTFLPIGAAFLFVALSGVLALLGVSQWHWAMVFLLTAGLSAASVGVAILLFHQLRSQVSSLALPFLVRMGLAPAKES